MTGCRIRAMAGRMTRVISASRSNGGRGWNSRAPGAVVSTADLECESRVVERINTGVWNCSLTSSATPMNCRASSLSAGSKHGNLPKRAYCRLSCSFCDENAPGSSALMSTSPPFTPVYDTDIRLSAATFTPTCFITAMVRAPPNDAPMALSSATFSLLAHSALMPG